MTARKVVKSDTRKPAKPKQRNGSKPTLVERMCDVEANELVTRQMAEDNVGRFVRLDSELSRLMERLDVLESRDRLRDKSHDEPVSNANEAIGQCVQSTPWWQFWRRA